MFNSLILKLGQSQVDGFVNMYVSEADLGFCRGGGVNLSLNTNAPTYWD